MRAFTIVATFLLLSTSLWGETVAELLDKARAEAAQGKAEAALAFANQAVQTDPKSADAYSLRAALHDQARRYTEAVADLGKLIELTPNAAGAYDRCGSARFMLGQIKESITDFDKFIALRPDQELGHWRRGISYYYAKRFEEGAKQFEGYEKVDTNDVENSVWRYLCQVPTIGVEKARQQMLKIGHDRRVPLMKVYDLFLGKCKPEDVLAAVEEGKPSPKELKMRRFYAHLYLGLYYESAGDAKKSLEHMTKAADDYNVGGYMWEVARVHKELRKKPL